MLLCEKKFIFQQSIQASVLYISLAIISPHWVYRDYTTLRWQALIKRPRYEHIQLQKGPVKLSEPKVTHQIRDKNKKNENLCFPCICGPWMAEGLSGERGGKGNFPFCIIFFFKYLAR